MASIKVDTGYKVYDIEDEYGEIRGQIKVPTNDLNYQQRAIDTSNRIKSFVVEAKNLPSEITREEEIAVLTDLDNKIKAEINKLFDDENASKVVFGNQHCLNTKNGISLVERFVNAIMPVIRADMEKEQKASMKRIEKYTKQVK